MNFKYIEYLEENNIGVLTICRPKVLNALNRGLIDELTSYIELISQKPELRVLIITGQGKAFIAGADISELENLNYDQAFEYASEGKALMSKFKKLKIPVIAAINGYALGGGFELALACDMIVADKDAKIGLPEASLGLIPGFNGIQRLTINSGIGNAMHIMSKAEGIEASMIYKYGLIQHLSDTGMALEDSKAIAQKIASRGKNAIGVLKKLVYKALDNDNIEKSFEESKHFSHLFDDDNTERPEMIKNFLDKKRTVQK